MRTLLIRIQGGVPQACAPVAFGPAGGTIGRADNNTLVLSDPERSVSRLHARIEWRGAAATLVNLGITPVLCNGTVLATGGETLLTPGDQLRIGRFALVVEPAPGSAQATQHLNTVPMPGLTSVSGVAPAQPEAADEHLYDDMTGLLLPGRSPARELARELARERRRSPQPGRRPVREQLRERRHLAQPEAAPPLPDGAMEQTVVTQKLPSAAPAAPLGEPALAAQEPPPHGTPSVEEMWWTTELLHGMGFGMPTWTALLTSQQVGELLRQALQETLLPLFQQYPAGAQERWFAALEAQFLRRASAQDSARDRAG